MAKMYATCAEVDYDVDTGTCAQVTYVEDASGWLPEMSREQGAELGAAMFGLMFVAWVFRKLRNKH